MIIQDANIMMASNRTFTQTGTKGSVSTSVETKKEDQSKEAKKAQGNFLNTYERYAGGNIANLQNRLIQTILERLLRSHAFGNAFSDMFSDPFRESADLLGVGQAGQAGDMTTVRCVSYSEYECTSFSANGKVQTADGRTIDFNIELNMTRSYMEYTDMQVPAVQRALRDPLVINVDNCMTDISDQKFTFDIDADGTLDEISMLGRGSGFLALDKNGDGQINDGSELFGTTSGDGFSDLRAYDEDGNGWIDEADDIFSKLKVWYKTDDGEDRLVDLKEAGVGALFLGNQASEFSAYGLSGLNGVIRKTGFFLKEAGGIGTMHQIDLAADSHWSKEDEQREAV